MPPPTNPPLPSSRPLTLIVATTPVRVASPSSTAPNRVGTGSISNHRDNHNYQVTTTRLGIGLGGTLPWPRIKADMNFFARVTSRPPAPGTTNAVIMGRKTYDSVPAHLRPLGKRINVVITRDTSGTVREGVMRELQARRAKMAATATKTKTETKTAADDPVSIETGSGAAAQVEKKDSSSDAPSTGSNPPSSSSSAAAAAPAGADRITDALVAPSLDAALQELDTTYGAHGQLGKIYVIGGAEIYAAALHTKPNETSTSQLQHRPVRIVMTNVARKPVAMGDGMPDGGAGFECDTVFPVDALTPQNGWRKASAAEMSEWVGEEVSGAWRDEGEVEIQMVGFERV